MAPDPFRSIVRHPRFTRPFGRALESARLAQLLYVQRNAEILRIVELADSPEGKWAVMSNAYRSQSQLMQDLFAIAANDGKRDGYFVEFGATDGMTVSNTWLLEQEFGWNGILAEPAPSWSDRLVRNRRCIVDRRCVWRQSGQTMEFLVDDEGGLSTLSEFADLDGHSAGRATAQHHEVSTVSLADLCRDHGAPPMIDFLSIDTEGSEFDILEAHDFDAFRFRAIAVEHNYTKARARIHALLIGQGYRRVGEELSGFDDWYVLDER